MNPLVNDLVKQIALERLDDNLFRGQSRDVGGVQVYGGQVLGQAVSAASQTVTGRLIHSLHSYFLLPGDVNAPIDYEVDRSRDGGNFSNRRVVASQHGKPIFHLSASFHSVSAGLEHQFNMPEAPAPEGLEGFVSALKKSGEVETEAMRRFASIKRPIDARPVPEHAGDANTTMLWFRLDGDIPDDEVMNRSLLAYCSDFGLISGAFKPHGNHFRADRVRVATIDHAMWFHRPVHVKDWHLHVIDTPNAIDFRGLVRGCIYSRDGRLVASTAQEGLIKVSPTSTSI
jgi:acyl-CoA thioesterase II